MEHTGKKSERWLPEPLRKAHELATRDLHFEQLREGTVLGGLHPEDVPELVREIIALIESEPDVVAVSLRLEWMFDADHHMSLEVEDVERGRRKLLTALSRVFCEDCGGVFYIPRPPPCFSGQAPPFRCPYCSGDSHIVLEGVTTRIQAPVPEPRRRR